MTRRVHACAQQDCREAFGTSSEASLHYVLTHLGRDTPASRPVSCWACGQDIDTRRDATDTVTVPACPGCGWVHPTARSAPAC